MSSLNILALSGSLRTGSFNTALLRAAAELAPEGVAITLHDYRDVPLYDGDIETSPEAVEALKAAIDAADAVLIATPEYNHSIPGVLKNAIDWASRPAFDSVFFGKPTGMVSASPGLVGGARAQQHLKSVLLAMGTPVYASPEVLVGRAGDKFDDGRLVDESTRKFLAGFLEKFSAWARGFSAP